MRLHAMIVTTGTRAHHYFTYGTRRGGVSTLLLQDGDHNFAVGFAAAFCSSGDLPNPFARYLHSQPTFRKRRDDRLDLHQGRRGSTELGRQLQTLFKSASQV